MATGDDTARRQLSQWQCITHLGSPVNWYSMARHWQWPVVAMAGLLAEGRLVAGPFVERARVVGALALATLAFAGMGTSWGSDGLGTGAGPSLSAVPPIAPAVRSQVPLASSADVAEDAAGDLVEPRRCGDGARLGVLPAVLGRSAPAPLRVIAAHTVDVSCWQRELLGRGTWCAGRARTMPPDQRRTMHPLGFYLFAFALAMAAAAPFLYIAFQVRISIQAQVRFHPRLSSELRSQVDPMPVIDAHGLRRAVIATELVSSVAAISSSVFRDSDRGLQVPTPSFSLTLRSRCRQSPAAFLCRALMSG